MKTILEKQKPQELTLNNILEHQQKPQELTLNNLSLNSNQLHYNLHQFKDQKSHEEKPLNVDQFLKNMQLSSEDVIMAPYFKDQPLDYEFKDLVNAAQRQPFKTITNPAEQLKESFAMQYQEVFKQSEGQRPMILDVAVGRQSPLDGDGMNGRYWINLGINAPIVSGNNMPPMVSSAAQIAPPTAINSRRIPFKRRSLQHVGHEEIISLYFDNEPEVLPGSCDSSVTTTLVSPSFGDSYSESSSPQMFTRSLSRASSRDGIYRQRSMSFQHGAPQRIYTPENSGSVYSTTVNPLYTRDSTSSLFYPDGNPSLYHQDSNSSLSTSAYTPDSNSVCTPDSSSVYNQDVSLGLNFAEVSFPKPRERAHSLATPTNFSTQYPSLKRRSVSGIIDLDHSHMKRVQKVAKTRKKQKSLDTISVSEFSASPDSTPRQQKLKGPDDLYTPRWVRYQGAQKEGLCDMCEPGKWLQLKNSAFWYFKFIIF